MSDLSEKLSAIEARLDSATPAPWDCDGFADGDVVNLSLYEGSKLMRVIASDIRRHGDADLLLHAPADLAFLLALVREQAAKLANVAEGRMYRDE